MNVTVIDSIYRNEPRKLGLIDFEGVQMTVVQDGFEGYIDLTTNDVLKLIKELKKLPSIKLAISKQQKP